MERHLRISSVLVQPVLLWDDGENLYPGPVVEPMVSSLKDLEFLAATLRNELLKAEEELLKAEGDEKEDV